MKELVIVGLLLAVVISDAAPRLKVSDNKRFLVREHGSPFFYLGDTAWELFHRLNREEADRYLTDRAHNADLWKRGENFLKKKTKSAKPKKRK